MQQAAVNVQNVICSAGQPVHRRGPRRGLGPVSGVGDDRWQPMGWVLRSRGRGRRFDPASAQDTGDLGADAKRTRTKGFLDSRTLAAGIGIRREALAQIQVCDRGGAVALRVWD